MTKSKVQKGGYNESMHLAIFINKPRHSHAKLLQSKDIDAKEKVWVDTASCYAGVNQRGYEKGKLDKANKKNGRANLEPRAESELPHFKKSLRSWIFRRDVTLTWYEGEEVLLLSCLSRRRLLLFQGLSLSGFGGLS